MPDKIKALYNLKTGKVGCALLQAAAGCGAKVESQIFSIEDWELEPTEGQTVLSANPAQWKFIADMTPAARVARFKKTA